MDMRDNPMGQGARVLVVAVAVVTTLSVDFPGTSAAQSTGVISGSVSVDQGEVRAFRVKAHDTAGRVAYTVYTVKGRYQIFNLPPGAYDVQVIEAGFEPLVKTAEVTAGSTSTVTLALTTTGGVSAQGAGAGRAGARANYGGTQVNAEGAELVDFDELYPPHPARDVMLRSCFGCHGPSAFHNRGVKNEAGWRRPWLSLRILRKAYSA